MTMQELLLEKGKSRVDNNVRMLKCFCKERVTIEISRTTRASHYALAMKNKPNVQLRYTFPRCRMQVFQSQRFRAN